jgi:hypothetical protein
MMRFQRTKKIELRRARVYYTTLGLWMQKIIEISSREDDILTQAFATTIALS